MASLWEKIKAGFARVMQGRYGADNLGFVALWTGLILNLLDGFLGTGLLSLVGMALYVWALYRMLSRNVTKRSEENRRFVTWWEQFKTQAKQFFLRLKLRKDYKYFRCPQCKALMRLKRGSGKRSFTCPKCNHTFDQQA